MDLTELTKLLRGSTDILDDSEPSIERLLYAIEMMENAICDAKNKIAQHGEKTWRCVECYADLGPDNPRQYCGKSVCKWGRCPQWGRCPPP